MAYRIPRLNNLFRQEISNMLQHQVKDPRLGSFVTVTDVSISADLRHAKVFVSHMGGEDEKQATLSALSSASGFFRRELAGRIRLRFIPKLSFHWDNSIEQGAYLLKLIDQVTAEDTINQPHS